MQSPDARASSRFFEIQAAFMAAVEAFRFAILQSTSICSVECLSMPMTGGFPQKNNLIDRNFKPLVEKLRFPPFASTTFAIRALR
jgi:hypothetical protein